MLRYRRALTVLVVPINHVFFIFLVAQPSFPSLSPSVSLVEFTYYNKHCLPKLTSSRIQKAKQKKKGIKEAILYYRRVLSQDVRVPSDNFLRHFKLQCTILRLIVGKYGGVVFP